QYIKTDIDTIVSTIFLNKFPCTAYMRFGSLRDTQFNMLSHTVIIGRFSRYIWDDFNIKLY
ncbi:MAG: hypothetical protein OXE56_02565, partial [Gammaproteobacteria bacterium]|nr:hypothetical protein [Gammaproteobacteria bacterium]